MPFDPTKPANKSKLSSAEMRGQLNGLNDKIEAQAALIAELQAQAAAGSWTWTALGFLDHSSDSATLHVGKGAVSGTLNLAQFFQSASGLGNPDTQPAKWTALSAGEDVNDAGPNWVSNVDITAVSKPFYIVVRCSNDGGTTWLGWSNVDHVT